MQPSIFFHRILFQSTHPPAPAFLAPPLRHSTQPFVSQPFLKPTHLPYCKPTQCPRRAIAISTTRAVTTARLKAKQTDSNTKSTAAEGALPTLVIVESPAKAATIQSILPSSQYRIRSCVGHIREIPSSAKRIPAKYKHLPWARLGVDITSDFRPIYVLISGKQSVLSDLRAELRNAQRLVLATDDDREGEAISWHLLEVLNPKIPVHRAVFHEITPSAIEAAFQNFRTLDMARVDAQETRRVLDRLAGYTMSPLLWRKVARGLSAGRVQSVAMSVIVRRERERLLFIAAQYAGCHAAFTTTAGSTPFSATLSAVNGTRLVRGADFDDATGTLRDSVDATTVRIFDRAGMQALCHKLKAHGKALVTSVDCRRTTRHPPLPLITSTLQQECGNRLGMGAGKTMMVAQKLYETGLITYMRTDNPLLGKDAVTACRASIEAQYGEQALWKGDGPARHAAKPKAAQAAHEAIRPAGTTFAHPSQLLEDVTDEERAVYAIIYRRALASQMASAKLDQTTVKLVMDVQADDGSDCRVEFKVTGSVIVEAGFLLLFEEDERTDASSFIPAFSEGDVVDLSDLSILDHVTKPPPRFNDASLVKVLEEQGVGRPSTYAGIIEKLITRGYVYRGRNLPAEKKIPPKALVPSLTAFAVEHLLTTHFPSFVDAQFTARMEEALDDIAAGSDNRVDYLQRYYCGDDGLAESVLQKENDIDVRRFRRVLLPNMPREMVESALRDDDDSSLSQKGGARKKAAGTAATPAKRKANLNKKSRKPPVEASVDGVATEFDWSTMRVLVSSYGPYVEQDGSVIASLPKTTLADDLSADRLQSVLRLAQDPVIGTDPETQQVILLRTSRFGPYVQLGRDEDMAEGQKPKRCSLFAGMDVGDVTVEVALKLLSLPRVLGQHAETDEEVRATMGPYGPYVAHGTTYVSLKKGEHDVLDISFEEAMGLLNAAEERKQKRLAKQAERKAAAKAAKVTSKQKKVDDDVHDGEDDDGDDDDDDNVGSSTTKKVVKKASSKSSSKLATKRASKPRRSAKSSATTRTKSVV